MKMGSVALRAVDDRLDRLVNLDIGGRGVEHLYRAAREQQGEPLVGAAADALLSVPRGGTVVVTTGSVSRAWISPRIGENDGPSGAAAVVRALALSRSATCVVLAEDALLSPLGAVMVAAGLTPVDLASARLASTDGSLATVVMQDYPTEDEAGAEAASIMLEDLSPDLLFSTERVGRNEHGIYHNMRGRAYGMGRARVDYLFDEALRRELPVVAVGDGGNAIGMARIADAVRAYVPFGDICACGCGGGLGAITGADVLVTAACSNWGCTAIVAAMAARTGDARILHTPEAEARMLDCMTANGLINSARGIVDADVDGIARNSHVAVAELCRSIVRAAL